MHDPFGFLNVDKPGGLTSHDVVGKIRRRFGLKKVGHAGTLDPMATGVLIICLGAATRLSEYAMQSSKGYRAVIRLGVSTNTYDADGEITAERDAVHITQDRVEQALAPFQGAIQQVPPMFSAIKQGGRKLYDLARSGQTVELAPRRVHMNSIELLDWQPPHLTLDIQCSPGTYIRSLAHDLGESLGVGAHLTALTRTASGTFTLENAVRLDDLLADEDWRNRVLPPDWALKHLPRLDLSEVDADHVRHGRSTIEQNAPVEADGLAQAYAPDGSLLAILQADGGMWKPHKVFLGEQS